MIMRNICDGMSYYNPNYRYFISNEKELPFDETFPMRYYTYAQTSTCVEKFIEDQDRRYEEDMEEIEWYYDNKHKI